MSAPEQHLTTLTLTDPQVAILMNGLSAATAALLMFQSKSPEEMLVNQKGLLVALDALSKQWTKREIYEAFNTVRVAAHNLPGVTIVTMEDDGSFHKKGTPE